MSEGLWFCQGFVNQGLLQASGESSTIYLFFTPQFKTGIHHSTRCTPTNFSICLYLKAKNTRTKKKKCQVKNNQATDSSSSYSSAKSYKTFGQKANTYKHIDIHTARLLLGTDSALEFSAHRCFHQPRRIPTGVVHLMEFQNASAGPDLACGPHFGPAPGL